jgi:hypothetical protein
MVSDPGSQSKAVDTAMAAHPVLADEAAVGSHLVDGELEEPRFGQSDDEHRPPPSA